MTLRIEGKTETVKRFWKIGATVMEDPFSGLPFAQSFELLAKQRSSVRHTQMFESDGQIQDDGSLLYEIPVIPPKTNG
ncbi:hypothetical protein [Enterovibrio norvegicus]|uniref:hypothetical protein n=1 Tax=Enterovibrio norvegicus TaxID=188144 RepID=UPI000C84CEF5|nr:hypothetical protein [Enterovibrio norvegicus]PMH64543.1 hypothetical protein BCU62_15930 [Enterovibrio norvegicus]